MQLIETNGQIMITLKNSYALVIMGIKAIKKQDSKGSFIDPSLSREKICKENFLICLVFPSTRSHAVLTSANATSTTKNY